MKRLILTILIFIPLGGCALTPFNSWDLSKQRPFSEMVGREVPLMVGMQLMEYNERVTLVRAPIRDPLKPWQEGEPKWKTVPYLVASLPAGTPLRITSVKGVRGFKHDALVACGEANLLDHEKPVHWCYTWGFFGSGGRTTIGAAVWEDPFITPERRMFANKGRKLVSSSREVAAHIGLCPSCSWPLTRRDVCTVCGTAMPGWTTE